MGMFDYVKCEFELPDKKLQNETFQTKDFEQLLDLYIITKDRKLKHKSLDKIKTLPYHGDITFYTTTGKRENKTLKWHEYIARFSYGKLDYIKKQKRQLHNL